MFIIILLCLMTIYLLVYSALYFNIILYFCHIPNKYNTCVKIIRRLESLGRGNVEKNGRYNDDDHITTTEK